MKTASYSQYLLHSTAFSQVQKGDGIAAYAWKVPTGRVVNSAVCLIALAEAFFFSIATIALSPLYLIDNQRFHTIADEAKDSAKTAGKAAGRIFGFGTIQAGELPPQPKADPMPPAKPTTLKGKVLQFVKDRASDVAYTALKHPNSTFVALTIVTTVSAAYYLGLFKYAASLIATTDAPKIPTPVKQATEAV